MMPFSDRVQWELTPNALSEKLSDLKKKGIPFLDLTVSNPTHCRFRYLCPELFQPFLDRNNLLYDPDPHGLFGAREAVCKYYSLKGIELSPDQIILTANTSEAYSFLFRLLANAHDSVLAPQPGYPILTYLTDLHDIRLKRYPLRRDAFWRPVFSFLPDLIQEARPRALLIVNPNNPTGNFVSGKEQNQWLRLSRASGIPLICDEVFLDFDFGTCGEKPESFAGNEEALTFTLSGISKILGLPQMKLSWIVANGPKQIRHEAIRKLEIISDTYLSVSTPTQNALAFLFSHHPLIRQEISDRIRTNYRFLLEALSGEDRLRLCAAEGGWTAVFLWAGTQNDETQTLAFLEKDRVLVHPGYLYDFEEETYLTVSLLTPTDTFQEGIRRILTRIGPENINSR